jgi:hypothetical protein
MGPFQGGKGRDFMKRTILMVLAAGVLAAGFPAGAQTAAPAAKLTNADVVALVKAGIPDEAVIARIRSSEGAFDLSTDGLVALKSAGVSGAVMAAMIAPAPAAVELSNDSPDPTVPHYPGLYLVGAKGMDGKMARINATVSNQARTSNVLGYALTMGLAPASVKVSIPQPSAKVQTADRRPVFYAYFEESVPRALQNAYSSTWASGVGTTTSSPAEVTLVKFVEGSNRRDAKVGTINIAGAKTGVMDKDQVAFESEQIAPGVFRLQPTEALEPGEYGFIQALSGTGTQGAMTARVFDFGVE